MTLARELLRTVPERIRRRFRIRVLADSGSLAAAFLDEVRQLGFEFVVGVRATRRTLHPGEVTVADCPHGGYVELKNWPHDTLVLGRLVFLAWTLAILHRETGMTLESCAALALMTVMPEVYLNRLLRTFLKNEEFLRQHGYSLRYGFWQLNADRLPSCD